MPFNGSGVFTRIYSWTNDKAANIKVRADRMDNEDNGFATGLSTCITKDGQTTITANLPMAGFRHTGCGDAVSASDYATLGQVQASLAPIVDTTAIIKGSSDATKLLRFEVDGFTTGTTRVLTPPNYNGTIATLDGGETFNNKLFVDSSCTFVDQGDTTKKLAFQCSGISTGTTRTLTVPNFDGTIATLAGTETFTNKTLTTPNIVGTSTNNNASAGSVGELIESEILAGASVSATSSVPLNVTSISLTAGDWDVWASVITNPDPSTTTSLLFGGVNTTSATLPTAPAKGGYAQINSAGAAGSNNSVFMQRRFSLASTTTIYLVGIAVFGVSTMGLYGYLGARRVR